MNRYLNKSKIVLIFCLIVIMFLSTTILAYEYKDYFNISITSEYTVETKYENNKEGVFLKKDETTVAIWTSPTTQSEASFYSNKNLEDFKGQYSKNNVDFSIANVKFEEITMHNYNSLCLSGTITTDQTYYVETYVINKNNRLYEIVIISPNLSGVLDSYEIINSFTITAKRVANKSTEEDSIIDKIISTVLVVTFLNLIWFVASKIKKRFKSDDIQKKEVQSNISKNEKDNKSNKENTDGSIENKYESTNNEEYCINCGNKIKANWKYCKKCGKKIE